MSTVSIIIIGDEILSGKFVDENTPWLIQRCKELNLKVISIRIIQDELQEISKVVRKESDRADIVITTGGVGPTHDDLTMKGVALAFDVDLCRNQELKDLISKRFGGNTEALIMADIPEGAELMKSADGFFPQVVMNNVYIFPGVPKLMKIKFDAIAGSFKGQINHVEMLNFKVRESTIAKELAKIQTENMDVSIGSYPRFDGGPITLILTIESDDQNRVKNVKDLLKITFNDFLVI